MVRGLLGPDWRLTRICAVLSCGRRSHGRPLRPATETQLCDVLCCVLVPGHRLRARSGGFGLGHHAMNENLFEML